MAWTYADFESQPTNAAMLTRLRLHITEVSVEFGPDLSINDRSRSNQYLVDYLILLNKRREQLEGVVGVVIDPDAARVRSSFVRARPV